MRMETGQWGHETPMAFLPVWMYAGGTNRTMIDNARKDAMGEMQVVLLSLSDKHFFGLGEDGV